jgi:hypothetical protein
MFDPYYKWLGIPPTDQPPDHYRLLGVQLFESDVEVIEAAANRQMAYVQQRAIGEHATVSQKLLNELSMARICLLNPTKKVAYDATLKGRQSVKSAGKSESRSSSSITERHNSFPAKIADAQTPTPPNSSDDIFDPDFVSAYTTPKTSASRMPWVFPLLGLVAAALLLLMIARTLRDDKEVASTSGIPASPASASPKSVSPSQPKIKPNALPPSKVEEQPKPVEPEVTVPEPSAPSPEVEMPKVAEPKKPEPRSEPEPKGAPRTKHPIPDLAVQARVLATIRDIYKKEYRDKPALAEKLCQKAKETQEVVERFVLLHEAKEIATETLQCDLAFEAIDAMASDYAISSPAIKAEVLEKAARMPRLKPVQKPAIATAAVQVMDEAIGEDNFDVAKKLGRLAGQMARLSKDKELLQDIVAKNKEVEAAAKAYGGVAEAMAVLKEKSDDPDANLTVGKYRCFAKSDWKRGLPMLALGSDQVLKAAAEKDIAGAASAAEQVKLGDAWWDMAKDRANFWYAQALPELEGLEQDRVAKRVALSHNRIGLAKDIDKPPESTAPRKSDDAPAENALRKGLEWLISHQESDGHWTFTTGPNPGTLGSSPGCATAMALIPLLRAGYTHRAGDHRQVIQKGLKFLASSMTSNSNVAKLIEPGSTMYGHAICTIALCEALAHTKDRALRGAAQSTVNFIIFAQDPKGGGWRYEPRQGGDTSVTGWQLTALVVAKAAKLSIPPITWAKADSFLDTVQMGAGASYSYLPGNGGGPATTSAGLLCRIHLGHKKDLPALQRGIAQVNDSGPSPDDMYFDYYGTQLMRCAQGERWLKWRSTMRDQLVAAQSTQEDSRGSWYFPNGGLGTREGGRLYYTALAVMILQFCEQN